MNISLVMVTADGKAKELPPLKLPIVIGRSEECKLRVPLAAVSRQHCELLEQDDELVARDLKSSNGTFVNKDRIKSRELLPGDLLAVGPVVFVVRIDGHPKDIDPIIAYANGAVTTDGAGGEPAMVDGVPTWSSQPPASPTPASGTPAAQPAPKPKPAPKADKDDSGSFEDLLRDLRESDLDDAFGDDKK